MLPNKMKHGDIVNLDVDSIIPNAYNPNEMSPDDIALLRENIDKVGFLDPILVTVDPSDDSRWVIIDGEHRFELLARGGTKKIPCIVADPSLFDEKTRKLQTVRMNKIRGAFNVSKFNALVKDLVTTHEIPFDEVALELGFTDEDEFQQLVSEGRKSIPRQAIKEYDKAVKQVDSTDQLYLLIERLWIKYGDTLSHNWMILDFGKKRHLWVRFESSGIYVFNERFRECMALGYTIDSLMTHLISNLDVVAYMDKFGEAMKKIEEGDPKTLEEITETFEDSIE